MRIPREGSEDLPSDNDETAKRLSGSGLFSQGHKLLNYDEKEIGPPKDYSKPLDDLYFSEEVEKYILEAKRWHKSQEWYKKRRIPWKRGWLLYGPPGTGKTSLVRAIAKHLGIPIYFYDLSSLRDKELIREWGRMVKNSTPCVALIEDIDGTFDGREKISTADGSLTFDTLLNVLDGIDSSDGVFLIITTNNLEKVDRAIGIPANGGSISTRPGRIDRCIKLEKMTKRGRMLMAGRILDQWPDKHEAIVEEGSSDTGAQFQERCSQLALDLFWQGDNNKLGCE